MTASASGLPEPHRLVHLAETDSTNAEAMRRALAGERGPLWVLADRQTAGRGRSGRTWASAPGNLFASLMIETSCPVTKTGQLSLVAGVAAVDALRRAGPLHPETDLLRLKWPNDILVGSAKVGGILIESSARAGQRDRVAVIGVGINLASAPSALAGATHLAAHGLALSPQGALCFLAETMDLWLKTWNDSAGFAAVRAAWLERAGPIGEPLAVHTAEGPVAGRFAGLDDEGALSIALAGGGVQHFTYGDVTLQGASDTDCGKDDDSR